MYAHLPLGKVRLFESLIRLQMHESSSILIMFDCFNRTSLPLQHLDWFWLWQGLADLPAVQRANKISNWFWMGRTDWCPKYWMGETSPFSFCGEHTEMDFHICYKSSIQKPPLYMNNFTPLLETSFFNAIARRLRSPLSLHGKLWGLLYSPPRLE